MRGLDALVVLNVRDGATVSEVAHEIRLPRTTVYRILETLCSAGFVFRDASDDRYRLTVMVRSLSAGFDDDAWVSRIAQPLTEELSREIVWPVSMATLLGTTLTVRTATDHSSPLAVERYSAGHRLSLLSSASGRVYLSFCSAAQRETLIDILSRSIKDEDRLARAPRTDLQRILAEVRTQGYAVTSRTRRLVEEISVSVPVMLGERVLACLSVRFTAAAVPLKLALERFLPRLKQCAAKISNSFVEQQAGARIPGAPEATA
ncbi:MAG TPA: IclR family transcriptional regulator C-terminal domain-containing protein [Steroidobacteraceae bacterium]|nr:IclR family transcriptional regulator C-terminal domain-containing protein [Steroidobacteraceae bacterium]